MEDIKQVFVFEKQGVDGILQAMDDLTEKYQVAEKAKQGVFAGLEEDAKKAKGALADTAKESAKASGDIGRLKTIAKGAGSELKRAGDNVKVFGTSIGDIRGRIDKAKGALGGFGKAGDTAGKIAAKGFSVARIGSLALNASLGLITVAFTLIATAVKRSQPLMDKFAVITAQVGAVVDIALDRVTAFTEGITAIFGGDKEAGLEKIRGSFAGIGDELQREIELTRLLTLEQQKLDREFLNLDIRRANVNKQLKELNFTIEDQTNSYAERADAARKFANIEQGLIAEEIEARERQLATLAGLPKVTDEFRAKLTELGQAGFVFEEVGDRANELSLTLDDLGLSQSTLDDARAFGEEFAKLRQAETASFEIQTTNNNKLVQLERERQQKALQYYEQRKKAEEDLQSFRDQIQGQLDQLAIDESEGAERIELERRVAQAQIDEAERVAREKFKAAGAVYNLETEFAELRAGVERDAAERTAEFRLEQARREIEERRDIELAFTELLTASADAELTLEEFKARERLRIQSEALAEQRAAAVEEFGEGSAQVLTIDVEVQGLQADDVAVIQDSARRVRDEALAGVEQRKAIRLAEAELLEESASAELTLEQTKQREKNRILIDALLERRKIISDELGQNAPEVKLLDLDIEGLQRRIDAIDNIRLDPLTRIKNKLQEAFNLDDETTAQLVEQSKVAFNAVVSGLEAIYERQLIENDRLLEQIDGRIEKIEAGLEVELEKQEQGLANNAAVLQARLDDENARRERAEQRRLEIEKKAARQRLIIDAAQQVSSLALAAVQLLASEASKGVVGLILAGAGIATIFSIAAQAKAQAAQFSQDIPEFREGGTILDGLVVGPSHEGGGVLATFVDDTTGQRKVVELEGGEHVTPRRQSAQYADLLEAVRTDRIAKLDDDAVLEMLGRNPTAGLHRETSEVTYVTNTTVNNIGGGTDTLTPDQVDRIVEAIRTQYQPVLGADGRTIHWVEPTGQGRPFTRALRN